TGRACKPWDDAEQETRNCQLDHELHVLLLALSLPGSWPALGFVLFRVRPVRPYRHPSGLPVPTFLKKNGGPSPPFCVVISRVSRFPWAGVGYFFLPFFFLPPPLSPAVSPPAAAVSAPAPAPSAGGAASPFAGGGVVPPAGAAAPSLPAPAPSS